MALVTDPAILTQLNADAPQSGMRPVTDPAILAQLNADSQPVHPAQPAKEPTLLERFMAKHPSLAQPVRQAGLTARYALEGVGSVADPVYRILQ